MLVVAAAVVALNTAAVAQSPGLQLEVPEVSSSEFRGPRFVDETRLGVGWKLAPVAVQLLDAWSTRRHLTHFAGRDLSWPRGEMNPLMRPLAHRGGAGWYAAKAGLGVLHSLLLQRHARIHGAAAAKKRAVIELGIVTAVAGSNSIQVVISR